jgi:hypothetical protein
MNCVLARQREINYPGGSVKRSLAMVFYSAREKAIPKACGFEAATRQRTNDALNT